VPPSRGKRLIVHAEGSVGVISDAILIYKSRQKTGDHRNEIDSKNFVCWLETIIIANLPQNSQTVKPPTSNSKNDKMKVWLLEGSIPFRDSILKARLYDLIKFNKQKHNCYVIDQILADSGCIMSRFLLYHPYLNPIELTWADEKQ
jgi:hypothetical protein